MGDWYCSGVQGMEGLGEQLEEVGRAPSREPPQTRAGWASGSLFPNIRQPRHPTPLSPALWAAFLWWPMQRGHRGTLVPGWAVVSEALAGGHRAPSCGQLSRKASGPHQTSLVALPFINTRLQEDRGCADPVLVQKCHTCSSPVLTLHLTFGLLP